MCCTRGRGHLKGCNIQKRVASSVEGARGNGSHDPTPNAWGTAALPPGLEVAKSGHLCPSAGKGGRNEEEEEEESARGEREGLGDRGQEQTSGWPKGPGQGWTVPEENPSMCLRIKD